MTFERESDRTINRRTAASRRDRRFPAVHPEPVGRHPHHMRMAVIAKGPRRRNRTNSPRLETPWLRRGLGTRFFWGHAGPAATVCMPGFSATISVPNPTVSWCRLLYQQPTTYMKLTRTIMSAQTERQYLLSGMQQRRKALLGMYPMVLPQLHLGCCIVSSKGQTMRQYSRVWTGQCCKSFRTRRCRCLITNYFEIRCV